jgi:hypothetical protein
MGIAAIVDEHLRWLVDWHRAAFYGAEAGLPSADDLKNEMSRFLSEQPPMVQAQMGQLMIDVSRTREQLGMGRF